MLYRSNKNIIGSLLLYLLLFVALQPACAQQAKALRPNIILIVTDDQRWDALGAAGNSIIRTPNMDQLARQGVRFKNAYVTTAICCVSRASILSGQQVSRHKIDDFSKGFSDEAFQQTYPMVLRSAGYTIGFVGKFGVGSKYPDPDLFDYWGSYREMDGQYFLTSNTGERVHNTDSVGRSIDAFLDRFGNGEKPFCLSVNFKAPHELDGNPPTYPVQEAFKNLYSDASIKEPLTAAPKYWNSFPDFFRTEENIGRVRWKPLFSTTALHAETVKNYYRLITGIDAEIGKLLVKLKQLGIEDNTVIMLMGDNGFSLGEHGLQGKWYAYEESVRVPLILYDPRTKLSDGKKVPEQIVLNIDIAPTILSLAGISKPTAMQGENLTDIVHGKVATRKDFFYKHDFIGTPALPKSEAVISVDWKYIVYTEHQHEELYHLTADPKETNNLAKNPKHQKQLQQMRERYKELKKEAE